jgi:tRNA pseudouridine38-40 synthase
MRYFAKIAYLGAHYSGWQKQPNGSSVQGRIEENISLLLRSATEVVGCGRTDAGVHASEYFLHFDFDDELPKDFPRRLNALLPDDIALHNLWTAADAAHARFSASSRSYEYHISLQKQPLERETTWWLPYRSDQLDLTKMQQAAHLLTRHKAFFPFCKTGSDNKTVLCDVRRAEWHFDMDKGRMVFHITADRFLRGMVRLAVGMCLNVGLGKLSLAEVGAALAQQTRLRISSSVPPSGLFLSEITYPLDVFKERIY